MTISYKWLNEYLPAGLLLEPERLSRILTSIGLEVESFHAYEEVKGGLKGLVIGEIISAEKHPNADKLTVTKVDIGSGDALQIVCGAPNVAIGQKVIVATPGTTIYPVNGDPVTMKVATIRSVQSFGMICAEDEIGMGSSHAGIMVLPPNARTGMAVSEYFHPYEDWIYEIGLTPNRMDAMSHWGVARDVCAYLSYHDKKECKPRFPNGNGFKTDNESLAMQIKIENAVACPRYSAISIANITIKESPEWLKQRLKSIGLRPINNIVDITNFIQHETGQPLHAFDADAIEGRTVIIKNLPEGTPFVTLDEKVRKLFAEDLMICNSREGMCIAGVYGGLKSGVTAKTKNIFLESACFDSVTIRKTSSRHGLKTDAASRFEKGTDISATVLVLKRAATLIKEICGGEIASSINDVYPDPKPKKQVVLTHHFLKKLSGKKYHPDAVRTILLSLGFEIEKEGIDEIRVLAPYHKPDISLPADIVEEILRIDGLDSVEIPDAITITPSVEENYALETLIEKIANYLIGAGYHEIMTNSITNAAYFSEKEQESLVRLINNLSADLNCMRPSMLETGLESVAYNLNRKNNRLQFFEFGRTYQRLAEGKYSEQEHLCVFLSGDLLDQGWRNKGEAADFYSLKGIAGAILQLLGIPIPPLDNLGNNRYEYGLSASSKGTTILELGSVRKDLLSRFDIKQPVYFADFNWSILATQSAGLKQAIREIPRFPAVQRDLAIVVPTQLAYENVEQTVQKIKLNKLQTVKLFDIFESEKLGAGKKSMAINFTFQDEERTLTDKEIETWMNTIISALEKDLQAEVRR